MPEQREDPDDNPGSLICDLLREIIPAPGNDRSSFVHRADEFAGANGELESLIHESTIHYLLRRLITFARYLYRKRRAEGLLDWERLFLEDLRKRLVDRFSTPERLLEKFVSLLGAAVRTAEAESRAKGEKREAQKDFKRGETLRCYICGEVYTENDLTHEHVWPRTVGGADARHNFKPACTACNNMKADALGAPDFHYERMSYISLTYEDLKRREWGKEKNRAWLAMQSRTDFRCAHCKKPAVFVGGLQLARLDRDDNWHFLNVAAFCPHHLSRPGRRA